MERKGKEREGKEVENKSEWESKSAEQQYLTSSHFLLLLALTYSFLNFSHLLPLDYYYVRREGESEGIKSGRVSLSLSFKIVSLVYFITRHKLRKEAREREMERMLKIERRMLKIFLGE